MKDARSLNSGKVSVAYYRILRSIVSLSVAPGQMIDKERVARELGISTQPVTSAVGELERDGFVVIRPQRGSFVAHIRLQRLREAAFVTTALMTAAYRRIDRDASPSLIPTLRNTLAEMEVCADRGDVAQAFNVSRDFRQIIIEATDNDLVTMEAIRARNYQQWGVAAVLKADRLERQETIPPADVAVRKVHRQYVELLQALEIGDPHRYQEIALAIHADVLATYDRLAERFPSVIRTDDESAPGETAGAEEISA